MSGKSPHSISKQQAIADAYKRGDKVVAIATTFGVADTYPAKIAKKFGIPRRPRGCQPGPKLTQQQVRTIKRIGLQLDELADQYGISRRTVTSIITGHRWGSIKL